MIGREIEMFEYDDELKQRTLSSWGFDVESLEIDKIQHVPMHQYRVSSQKYPMLYVDNLQCCVGLYAYGNGFGFAAHINPVVMRGNEYEHDSNNRPIYFKRTDDLLKCILECNLPMTEPLKIGIATSEKPLDESYPAIKMIYDKIDELVLKLNSIGIATLELETITAPEFILDSKEEKLITVDNKKNKQK